MKQQYPGINMPIISIYRSLLQKFRLVL